jgi:hypothetical protein
MATPKEFVALAQASSVGREFLAFVTDAVGKKPLDGLKPDDVLQVASESKTLQDLLAKLDERFVRADEYLVTYRDVLTRDGNGWITKKKTKVKEPADLEKILTRKKRLAPGSKDLGLVRAMRLGVMNPELSFASFKYPESCLVAKGAQTDVINIAPAAPAAIVKNLKEFLEDPPDVNAREVASELVVGLTHEMQHTLVTYERIAARVARPHEPSVPEAYYELYQEEQSTREVALQAAAEIGYSLPRRAIDEARSSKDLRNLPVGYTDVLGLWQREQSAEGLSYAEVIVLDVVLPARLGAAVVCDFDAAVAVKWLEAAGLETGTTLQGWDAYRAEIEKIKKPSAAPKQQLELYTRERVKRLFARRFKQQISETKDAEKWNRAFDEELRLRADMVFRPFGLSYQKLYRDEGIEAFLPRRR